MKTLIISLIATAAILTSTFAQAGQKIEKVLGQCQVTKVTVLKSKDHPKGTQAVNDMATFTITRSIDVINEGTPYPSYYDQTYLYVNGGEKQCLPMGCTVADISRMKETTHPNGPQEITHKFKVNTSEKLDLLLSEPNYTDWMRLTYDYKKGTGKLETRTKINDWGFSTMQNDHFVYELSGCNFQGPISLNPSQI